MGLGKVPVTGAALAGAGAAALFGPRLRSAASVRQLSRGEDAYGVYSMDVFYDYDIDRIVARDYKDSQGYVQAVLAEALPHVPVHIDVPSFGCSALQLQTTDGIWFTGRNYDFRRDTSLLIVRCAPKDGYGSVALAALDNVGIVDPTASIKNRLACLAMPFACLDGMNSQGVTVSVLTLDSEPTVRHTGKPMLATSLVMRLVLDRAATTDEAVELLGNYDMLALNGRDYHFFISDARGNSVAVEYDCNAADRAMTVTPTDAITNFCIMYGQDVVLSAGGERYGHGVDRYETILDILCRDDGSYNRQTAWECLHESAQLPNPDDVTSNTQWSAVYDHANLTVEVVHRRRWQEPHLMQVLQG